MKFCSEFKSGDCLVWENNEVVYFSPIICSCPPGKHIGDIRNGTKKLKAVYRFINGVPEKIWERKELNEVEKAVIALAKALGCEWIAMDYDGNVSGFFERPIKRDFEEGFWDTQSTGVLLVNGKYAHKIHFVSWEDEEPYYIGGNENE